MRSENNGPKILASIHRSPKCTYLRWTGFDWARFNVPLDTF